MKNNVDKATPKTPRVGLEPTSGNHKVVVNKELTKSTNPVLSTGLDKILQKYPKLGELAKVWPELPEQVKNTIKVLVQTYTKTKEQR